VIQYIERPQSFWLRRAVFQVHLWTGVVLALYVVAISLSGSAIVFADRITDDVADNSHRPSFAKPRSLDELVRIARSQRVGFTMPTEILANASGGPIEVRLSRDAGASQYVYLDPSGRVLASVSGSAPRHAIMDFLTNLHVNLLGGSGGSLANGTFGAGLGSLAFTGLILWWPGRRSWRRALVIKARAGTKRLLFDIHSTGGFWTSFLVVMFSFTGVALVFFGPWNRLVAALLPTSAQSGSTTSSWKIGGSTKPLAELVARAAALEPTLHWDLVEIPDKTGGPLIVRLTQPGVPLRLSRHAFVYLDPATGDVLEDWRSANRKLGDLITWYITEGLHYGDYAVGMQCAWVIIGLAPAFLAISAIALWSNRLMRWRLGLERRRSSRAAS